MLRTLGCADIGYECAYRIITDNNQDDFILDTTLKHAREYHPEMVQNDDELKDNLKRHIRNLLHQSGYNRSSLE